LRGEKDTGASVGRIERQSSGGESMVTKPSDKAGETKQTQACSPRVTVGENAVEPSILSIVLKLDRMVVASVRVFTDLVLEECLRLTNSEIGFLALITEEGASLTIPSWSRPCDQEEQIAHRPLLCSTVSAGSWADSARTAKVAVRNRGVTADPLKRNFPGGYEPINRLLSVPVVSGGKPQALVGVANKATEYTSDDARRLTMLMDQSYHLIQREQHRMALEESEKRYRLMVDSMNEGLTVFDQNCNVTYVNDRFCRMLEYSRGELEGKSAAVFLDDHDQAEFYDRIAHNKDEGYRPYEVLLKVSSGRDLPVNVSPQALFDAGGNFVGSFAVVTDVSHLKQTEASLRAANEQLEAEQAALREKNIALREVLSQFEEERKQLHRQVQSNVDRVLMPIVNGLRRRGGADRDYVDFLRTCLDGVTSPFVNELDRRFARLSPRELEICSMIRTGRSTKEIAAALHTSIHTVHNQRKKIRKKLKIAGVGVNLRSFLNSIDA
jgi:PAS domain S-box-containing protein